MDVLPGTRGLHLIEADGTEVPISPAAVTGTNRSTRVSNTRTVEHLMSALSGLGITDVDLVVHYDEFPAMDGSAEPFFVELADVGLQELGSRKVSFTQPKVTCRSGLSGEVVVSVSAGTGNWTYNYESQSLWPYAQSYSVRDIGSEYRSLVAPARTFLRSANLDQLSEKGLARGIDRRSALIVGESGYETPARMPQELVAHKLLDLVGDLYLTGVPARFVDVVAWGSGHRANVATALEFGKTLRW